MNYTVKLITSFDECERFLYEYCHLDPFDETLSSNYLEIKDSIITSISKPLNHLVIAIFKKQIITGLFDFCIIREEKYLEMLKAFSNDKETYNILFSYLKNQYHNYKADIVFNPNNQLVYDCLSEYNATFETQQQKMVYTNKPIDIDTSDIVKLNESYYASYIDLHNKDMYWTGEKVIAASDRFNTYIAVNDKEVIGYVDVTYTYEENEPCDLFVKKEYRHQGYGRKLLAKALQMNKNHKMMLHVNIDNIAAINLYESLGFVKVLNQDSILAIVRL